MISSLASMANGKQMIWQMLRMNSLTMYSEFSSLFMSSPESSAAAAECKSLRLLPMKDASLSPFAK